MSDRLKGYLVTLAGVLIITPDALLLRLIEADLWTILFYRGLGFFTVLFGIVVVRYRSATWSVLTATGFVGAMIAMTNAIGQILFVYSIHHTQAANTLVIVAAIPLATAAIAWLWLGEAVGWREVISGCLALVAVALTMMGGFKIGGTSGDIAALGVVFCLAFLFTALRRLPARDMLPAIALSGLVGALLTLPMITDFQVRSADVPWLVLLCLFISPVSFALISLGPRYLPAPEVALLLLVETIVGPFWVWLVLAEMPSDLAVLGGLLMIVTLAVNSWLMLRKQPVEKCSASIKF